ncbi:MAG: chitobiase/beta-hexosaminidase C-terminal domain-containing protein [Rikenellaceae bacterium]|nr:chitobiase/beta-hexosaminidase C-terminal domain-containing protein [Rikenellaceae bacterium]
MKSDHDNRALVVTLEAHPSAKIYYTTDGSEPGKGSTEYAGPFAIAESALLRAVAVLPNGIKSAAFTEDISFNKATLRPMESFTQAQDSFDNLAVLNDGVKGKTVYGLGGWAGFGGEGMDIVIDLKESMPISRVTAHTMSDFGSNILDITSISVLVSAGNEDFVEAATATYEPHGFDPLKNLHVHTVAFPPLEARYIRIVMDCNAEMPPERYEPGIVPSIFVSEIEVD